MHWVLCFFFAATLSTVTCLYALCAINNDFYSQNRRDINVALCVFFIVSAIYGLFSYCNTVHIIDVAKKEVRASCANAGTLAVRAHIMKKPSNHGIFAVPNGEEPSDCSSGDEIYASYQP